MIEILHCGGKNNKTMFKLESFNTQADIKDKGPLNIPVAIFDNVSVGSDVNGTYINFGGGYLFAGSSLLTKQAVEINMVVGDIKPTTRGVYANALFDTRPNSINGNEYAMFGITNEQAPPYVPLVIIPAVNANEQYVTAAKMTSYPVTFKLVIKPTGTQLYMNGVLIHSQTQTVSPYFNGGNLKIARHAWNAAVPEAQFKLYYFDIIEL